MFQNRTLNNRTNKLQERALRLVHDGNTSSFYELPQKTITLQSFTVNHRIAPKTIFNETNVPYNIHQDVGFCSYNVKSMLYVTATFSYLGPKIWNLVPFNIRNCVTEQIFR